MKFKSALLMALILLFLSGSTIYFASRKEEVPEPCEIETQSEIYLAVSERYPAEIGDHETEDETVAFADEEGIVGLSPGKTRIVSGCHSYIVHVSDLYTVPVIDMDKEYLPEGRYTSEENRSLDTALAYLIDEAGYQSRAAAVEAARFLTLRFRYKLNYFYENGRMDKERGYIDGEGRYYHKGLYLSSYKQENIDGVGDASRCWGTPIYECESDSYTANGLDCSGFIAWALYNAGYDCGDIGAGPSEDAYDLTDLGEMVSVWDLDLGDVRCGDLCGLYGHIGMIIGMDEDHIYVAEAYWVNDLQVRVYDYDEFIESSEWEYVILMDGYYKNDGNYTDFWE